MTPPFSGEDAVRRKQDAWRFLRYMRERLARDGKPGAGVLARRMGALRYELRAMGARP